MGIEGIDEEHGGDYCYYNCKSLEDYEQIPEIWKKEEIIRPV